ncbi:hypothetical protein CyaNS01_02130 [Cyanobium sp. NS01]|nr:hypothetical protein CyaNS01_02130 [Cyanobium sp. NS01]
MEQTVAICQADGKALVIRDHSHTAFCMGEALEPITPAVSHGVARLPQIPAVAMTLTQRWCRGMHVLDRCDGIPTLGQYL